MAHLRVADDTGLLDADLFTVLRSCDILRKFRGKPPSLIVHLHPTHFRFDQQDGNFSYASAMRAFLEHVKTQTIPHDMLEELFAANVKFYDGAINPRKPSSRI